MYISFLDYLKELKSKSYIVVLFILIFLAVSYSFNLYKMKDTTFRSEINFIKFSTKMETKLIGYDVSNTIDWISDSAVKFYLNKEKIINYPMNCEKLDAIVICRVKGKIKNLKEEREIIDNMKSSINGAFDEYEEYYVEIIDDMIAVSSNILTFVEGAGDVTVNEIAKARTSLENQKMAKIIFSKAIDGTKVNEKDISVNKYSGDINYLLIVISAFICSLFIIFLQMKDKNKS